MPRYVDAVCILSEPRKGTEVLDELFDLFRDNGITFVRNSLVIFNDSDNSEREPESASTAQEAKELLACNRWLGGTRFNLAGQGLTVFFFGLRESYVDAVTMSIASNAYSEDQEVKSRFEALIYRAHCTLDATRSIADSELLSPNSFWKEEVQRLRNSVYDGNYAIDLRRQGKPRV